MQLASDPAVSQQEELLAISGIERFGVERFEKLCVVLIAESRERRCVVPPNSPQRDVGAILRKARLPREDMIILFQQRDGLPVLDRMRPDRRLIALHRWFEAPTETNLSGSEKLGQVFGLQASWNTRRMSTIGRNSFMGWAGNVGRLPAD